MGFQRAFQNTTTPTVKAFDRHVHFHMIPHHNVRQTHTHWWPPASSYICSACKHSVRSAFYPWKCAVFEGGKSHRIVLAVAALNPTSHRIEVRAKLSPKGCRQTVENRMKKSKGMVRWGERWGALQPDRRDTSFENPGKQMKPVKEEEW